MGPPWFVHGAVSLCSCPIMRYTIRPPFFLKWYYTDVLWRVPTQGEEVYLTFDDGPHPVVTPFVLEQLRVYGVKATFFFIGNNVRKYPEVAERVRSEGHSIGNHTYDHLNGWSVTTAAYLENIEKARGLIPGNLFRPPYGRLTRRQLKGIRACYPHLKVVLWDLLSGDFDQRLSGEDCYENVMRRLRSGSVVVFHDSEKAFPRLKVCLPKVLESLNKIKVPYGIL